MRQSRPVKSQTQRKEEAVEAGTVKLTRVGNKAGQSKVIVQEAIKGQELGVQKQSKGLANKMFLATCKLHCDCVIAVLLYPRPLSAQL